MRLTFVGMIAVLAVLIATWSFSGCGDGGSSINDVCGDICTAINNCGSGAIAAQGLGTDVASCTAACVNLAGANDASTGDVEGVLTCVNSASCSTAAIMACIP